MITYLDTSSLVKLYVEEAGTDDVRMLVSDATAVATSSIAYPEMRAALARRYRERSLGRGQYVAVKRALEADWERLVTVVPTSALCLAAGQLAERHRLRGFDSVHLASFVDLLQSAANVDVEFSSFDTALNRGGGVRAARVAARTGIRSIGPHRRRRRKVTTLPVLRSAPDAPRLLVRR